MSYPNATNWKVENGDGALWHDYGEFSSEENARREYEKLDEPKRLLKVTYELKEIETDDV